MPCTDAARSSHDELMRNTQISQYTFSVASNIYIYMLCIGKFNVRN